jgi:hypothetical protein
MTFKKKDVKSSEKRGVPHHLRTSSSTVPVPLQAWHFFPTDLPEPLHARHARFSRTVTSLTMLALHQNG